MKLRTLALSIAVAGCTGAPAPSSPNAAPDSARAHKPVEDRMSPLGRIAFARAQRLRAAAAPVLFDRSSSCDNEPDCEGEEEAVGLGGGQAETSLAVDETGQHVVIGYNDTRGFFNDVVSVSGVAWSDDGGKTFVDGGQLPTPGSDVIGGQKFPQVYGDPSIKYLGHCTFVYASILMKKWSSDPADTSTVQTMSLHRSTDCGHTWQGPFEITAASNPSGLLSGGAPADAADKEFLDADPDTGRLLISWTNFTPAAAGGVEIRTAFSDDAATAAVPTWSAGAVVSATEVDGQASVPAFAGNGSTNAYVAWRRFPGALTNNVGFARSIDSGATWQSPIDLTTDFLTMDQVLGNDRNNTSPSVAVDNSRGRHRGNVYVVYANNDNHDGADIAFQRSTDNGQTFSAPIQLDSRPGQDRAQWFPWVTVDDVFGRVYVFYYDQGVASSGDLTQTTYTWSDDGGVSWARPRPMTDRPFHAAWGNDTGQPNLGDYIQAVATRGDLLAVYAATRPVGFADGEPGSTSMPVPDVELKRLDFGARLGESATLQLADVHARDLAGDGYLDPGDVVFVQASLTNYVTNPLNATKLSRVIATVDSDTPGVFPLIGLTNYPSFAPGETHASSLPIILLLSSGFVPGTPIELTLHVSDLPFGLGTLHATIETGRPSATTLLSESFDSVAPGALPAGWAVSHGGGANVVPWTTSSSFCGATSNGAFHVNADDGPVGANGRPGNPTRFERLFSPVVTVPADAGYVTLDFDVCYDTEDDPAFNVQAYDGLLVRVFDATPGRMARSVLLDAFASRFTTGDAQGYPKHFPRSSNRSYFEDMSAWAGDSGGLRHVSLALPGMAGSTVQLRFEFTQDGGGTCADVRPGHSCGVLVDNVVVKSVKSVAPSPSPVP